MAKFLLGDTTTVIWIGVVFFICLRHVDSCDIEEELLENEIRGRPELQGAKLQYKPIDHVVLSNGIINVTLTIPDGYVSSLSYQGSENLLDWKNKEDNRGYWDMTWGSTNDNKNDRLLGTSYKIIVQNQMQTEISFTRTWNPKNHGEAPLNIDKRFVILKDTPGFYTYTVLEHLEGWPSLTIQQARIVFKYQDKFNYMAMSDARQRFMPSVRDRGHGVVLNYKEAVQLTEGSFKGEVDDKYYYSNDNKDIKVHGWVGNGIGSWMITPSNEFRAGGPFKQSLTSHVGPTMLNMFTSTHYVGEPIAIEIASSEHWKMIWGPIFIYLNSNAAAKKNPSILWNDAKKRAQTEENSWPYSFPLSKDFQKSGERGSVFGQLYVHDRYKSKEAIPASFAYIGLARPGDAGSWQYENKGYQFWTQANNEGKFVIKNVLPGTYSLYATIPLYIGDYKYEKNIIVRPQAKVDVKNITFFAPRNGPTLWEIGIPDRTAAEFFIPNPNPNITVHKYPLPVEKFREYGLWSRNTDLYPNHDLVFTIGKNDYKKDFFFAQVNRPLGGRFQGTTWEVVFNLQHVEKNGNYTLQLAIAGAFVSEVQVYFNNPRSGSRFSTGLIGKENIIARHGIHGVYRLFSIPISGNSLIEGKNSLFLRQSRASGAFGGVMYDYIRLEGPPISRA